MDTILILSFQLLVLLFSVIVHEVSHGVMALRLGDETAKQMGRLTLNPIKHLDPVGSFVIPVALFLLHSPIVLGWAKPVPYNPIFLSRDPKFGSLKVALAGPASNLAIAAFGAAAIRIGAGALSIQTIGLIGFIVFLNTLLAVFNLMPVPPLDGSKILASFLPHRYKESLERFGMGGIFLVLMFLFLFSGVIFSVSSYIFKALVGGFAYSAFLAVFGG